MFKSPINRQGELQYKSVITYTIIIGLFIMAYVRISEIGLLSSIIDLSSIITVLSGIYLTQLFIVVTVDFINLLRAVIKPVITYFNDLIITIDNEVYLIKAIIVNTYTSNLTKELCSYRC